EVLGLDLDDLDISAQDEVDRAVGSFKPTHIVNAAAYNAVDAAEDEPDRAFSTNAFAPGCIALAARRAGASMIHYSTDYVFDGKKASDYTEEDKPNPLSIYAQSKLLGERSVLNTHRKSYVLRTSWLFGPGGQNFVSRLLKLANEKPELSFIDDQLCAPTYAPDLARASFELMEMNAPFGIYHATGAETMTPYAWAKSILAEAGIDKGMTPVSSNSFKTKAARPARSVLSTAKLVALGITIPGGPSRLPDYFAGRIEVKP
ncbi:MAG TPA: dTDP-4-dehydrorhamnose reductase, partial [bacterium]|nr:dTDP-4-dehydrorhamnose reductase [bacterium]